MEVPGKKHLESHSARPRAIGVTRKWVLHREMELTGILRRFPRPADRENREISGCPLGEPPPNAFHDKLQDQYSDGDGGIKIMERG
jgi:hypothetical protein